MMNCKMKQLALAVGMAVGGMGLLPSAQAVNVSADHLGQALIFPYYTVRGGWNTLLGITNTTDQVVAVKVRFREAYNSRDVLDFDIVLSPHDLWNATVFDSESGPVLSINPDENTCTVGLSSKQQAFPEPISYTGTAADGGPGTVDRLREGYVEMIMIGAGPAVGLAAGAVHGSNGIPANCAAISQAFRAVNQTPAAALAALTAAFPSYPANALKGTFSLVNGANGYNAVGLPTHLAAFRSTPAIALHTPPSPTIPYSVSWHEPSLAAADNVGQFIDATAAPGTLSAGGGSGATAVTYALSQTDVLNEWSRNPTGLSAAGASFVTATDWVISFPTKNFYVDAAGNEYSGRATVFGGRPGLPATGPAPFASSFNGTSCDTITPSVRNREEVGVDVEFPSPSGRYQLCREVNVLTFNDGFLLGNSAVGQQAVTIKYPSSFLYGWMNIHFDPTAGLPAIGFAITSRASADESLLSEAALYEHSYVRPVAATAP
ncbi:MAG: hypothetical protein V9G98_18680 [Candidatus Competibacter sp.]|jgi:hypothetical protein